LSQEAYRAALTARGAVHPDALVAASNLSIDLRAIGQVDEAEELLRDTLGLRRRLGANHPTVISVATSLRVDIVVEPPSA
jgi:hypothetical protein